ncbi:hypothetical protein LSUE1_G007358 [Lachnellula suecica]|uniref:Serum paraoxonase/arylesterase n=1 Tax=Lachnellula suecica TaxID=602035 RepID=A0A8T9C402_9HELO|nr:hypothetical protein LSUE1_G007358 [Lachnellula suecica]
MVSKPPILASAAVLLGVFYQLILRDIIFVTFGLGRTYNHIEDFPYACRRLRHSLLESCEDLVLDGEGRRLYAACSTINSRKEWTPNGNNFNISAREGKDHISVLSIDSASALYDVQPLEITGTYTSSSGGNDIDLLGLDLEVLSDSQLRFWIVNTRPPTDEAGNALDPAVVGANSTIEVFHLTRGSSKLEHAKTILSDAVLTPNNVAATSNGGSRAFDMLLGGGSVAICPTPESCHTASKGTFTFPNGIVRDLDGLYYVSNVPRGTISVLQLRPESKTLVNIEGIYIGMPIDNLSIDANGDIFGAGFPKVLPLVKALSDPWNTAVPSTVFRIRKVAEGEGVRWEVTKVLEDIKGKYVSGATTAVYDAQMGRFFFGGVMAPFVAVCERKQVL